MSDETITPEKGYLEAQQRVNRARISSEKHLYLDSLRLKKLPPSLAELTEIEHLDLSGNELQELPKWIGNLVSLETLNVSGNHLTDLPESLANLENITKLVLGDYELFENDSASGNPLNEIPDVVRNLSRLSRLDLDSCNLSELPSWIGELTELETLCLMCNKLRSLPSSMGNLSRLRTLVCDENQLRSLPLSLAKIDDLSLYIDENPLNPELNAALEKGSAGVITYLRQLAEDGEPLYQAKLILVGEGEVGKSSLLGALRGDPWEEGRDTTHGIEIKQVHIDHPGEPVEITLNGWDFGGQPVYRPTHQLFFSAPAIYLVVWKPREGPELGQVSEWIKLIKNRVGETARILVVATHGGPDQRQAHIDEDTLQATFGEMIAGFHHVDSKPSSDGMPGFGIKELKEKIAQLAADLPEMGRDYPKRWENCRRNILDTDAAYISHDAFENIAARNDLDTEETKLFAGIAHQLGHWIHYADDPGLKDVVVLKADWLSKALSFALEDGSTKNANGLVDHSRLRHIWHDPARPKEEQYPSSIHPVFLRLMEKFDISYRIHQEPLPNNAPRPAATSLIAQLVPGANQRPDAWPDSPADGECEQVQICRIVEADTGRESYPEGLFYQLIVRLHRYSLGRTDYSQSVHWQKGMVLADAHNGCALLRSSANEVRITVRAAYPGFFLHRLTEEVRHLVESFWPGLKCRIMVPCADPCKGVFEVEDLIMSKQRGHPEFLCQQCKEWKNIDGLMQNAARDPVKVSASEVQEIKHRLGTIMTGVQTLSAEERRARSQADEQFAALMRAFSDPARDGPCLFSLVPVEKKFWDLSKAVNQKVRLMLWCEHSRLPLPFLNEGDDKTGVVELTVPHDWLVKVAPYAKWASSILSLVLPGALATVKLELNDADYKAIEEQLSLGEKSLSAIAKGAEQVTSALSEGDVVDLRHGKEVRAEGGVLRTLHAMLKEKDPSFGSLIRVQDSQHNYLWIHEKFIKEYHPDPPVFPDA